MAVYVDDMYKYPIGRYGRMKMSHMYADTTEELLEMADTIGLKRKWLQNPKRGKGWVHFDVSMSYRARAVAQGAKEMTMRELTAMCMQWRKETAAALMKKCVEKGWVKE